MYIIYKTTNIINNKIYIGIHKTENKNDTYLGSGLFLKKAIKKYGKENFTREILFEFTNDEEQLAWDKEREIVNKDFVLRKDTYNLSIGGYKMSVLVGELNPFYGKKHSDEFKQKMSKIKKGTILSKEHKEKISMSSKKMWEDEEFKIRFITNRTGKKKIYTEEGLKRLKEKLKDRVLSEETRKKISDSRKRMFEEMTEEERKILYDKVYTEETRKKISDSQKGKKKDWVANKINRNPDKIRKTAEKHRGMKRTEETKKRISESKKGKEGFFRNKFCVYNPQSLERLWLNEGDEIPPNFIKGTGLKRKRRKQG